MLRVAISPNHIPENPLIAGISDDKFQLSCEHWSVMCSPMPEDASQLRPKSICSIHLAWCHQQHPADLENFLTNLSLDYLNFRFHKALPRLLRTNPDELVTNDIGDCKETPVEAVRCCP